ncbi:uncharacterized protein K452DRAFT_224781 [Aplosporella prunicola CBS 121167]|uniref:Poly A polymerase head domain-containing protein n=1 Tax=Aplosporella prunicola CBS 121167 TaxID=1176127 RepID=A0A6A6BJM3_9PEZI|nr:uncharacterized protein K452DRAFT_224781 [Aplosporella prunicola CBS 121167]KAF2143828.1 hypothetical protein K452DRAFT_224781 [Aplosporella prunicola CBS 121167]
MATAAPTAKMLELTEIEQTLRRLLLDVAKYIDENPAPSIDSQVELPQELADANLVLRFTGGWVRDKLLGVGSHDIDVAINKMTGYQFGLRMKDYLSVPGNPEKYGLEGIAKDGADAKAGTTDKSKRVGGLHKIEANPEKSKHLETVTTNIMGLDIDLVNLRKETYSEDSRNPQMEFGSPEEDALRRDATVNAMFYNLETSEIEDFTGKGFEDMQLKVIRTPLEPYQTFKDDPLRVLRLIRFASRLFYTIDPAAEEAMGHADIKEALRIKISRERVGVELEKALKGPDPVSALYRIEKLGLYETVFSDPTKDHNYTPPKEWPIAYQCLNRIIGSGPGDNGDSSPAHQTIRDLAIRDADDRYLAWLISAFVPWTDAPEPQPSKPGSRAPPPIAAQVAREGIKTTNRVCDIIIASIKNLEEIRGLKDRFNAQQKRPDRKLEGENPAARDTLGMAIRRWGPTWRNQVVYALLYEVMNMASAENDIITSYSNFLSHIQNIDVGEAYNLKPLLDGKALAKALETPPGPWMKPALDVVTAWQLRNPSVTDAGDVIEDVRVWREANPDAGREFERERPAKPKKGKKGEPLTPHLAAHFLRLTIRPLFAKARNPEITRQGRKSMQTERARTNIALLEDETETQPWKSARAQYALDLLRWTVLTLSSARVEQEWALLVPPILTLVDDASPPHKTTGAALLHALLLVTPPPLLQRTGLAPVFHAALMPCLTYLPPLTPESDALPLLHAAFPALRALARVAHPLPNPHPPTAPFDSATLVRARALDRLVTDGVVAGFAHAGQHVRVAALLLRQLGPLLHDLGVHAVKHLGRLVPLLADVLADPLGAACLPLLREAAAAAGVLVRCAWVRAGVWRGEVLRGVGGAWVGLVGIGEGEVVGNGGGAEGVGVGDVRSELRALVGVLGRAVCGDEALGRGVWERECAELVKVEGRLGGLFEGVVPVSEGEEARA